MPWLSSFPKDWVLPATDLIGSGVKSGLTFLKLAARLFSALMAYPMEAANGVLAFVPWPLLIAAAVAMGWRQGGIRVGRCHGDPGVDL